MEREQFTGDVAVVDDRHGTRYYYPFEDCPSQGEAEVFLGPGAKHLGYMKSARIWRCTMPGYLNCTDWEIMSGRKIHPLPEA